MSELIGFFFIIFIFFCLYITDGSVLIIPALAQQVYKEGDVASNMSCKLDCTPSCRKLELFKDREFYRTMNDSSIFGTKPLILADQGEYQCKAKTYAGTTIESNVVFVYVYGKKNTCTLHI